MIKKNYLALLFVTICLLPVAQAAWSANIMNLTLASGTVNNSRINDTATTKYFTVNTTSGGTVNAPAVPTGITFTPASTTAGTWFNGTSYANISITKNWSMYIVYTQASATDMCIFTQAINTTDRMSACIVSTGTRFSFLINASTVQSSNATIVSADGQCHVTIATFNQSQNRIDVYTDGTQGNSGAAAPLDTATTGANRIGASNSTGGRPFNGTIYAIGAGDGIMTSAERSALEASYCNPVVIANFSTTVRTINESLYGWQESGSYMEGNASRGSSLSSGTFNMYANYQLNRNKSREAGIMHTRFDADFRNVLNILSPTSFSLNFGTGSNGANIDNHRSIVQYYAGLGGKVKIVLAYMPNSLAVNDSRCSSSLMTCPPSNNQTWLNMVNYYLNQSGCRDNGTTCEVTFWNEPYLDQFWEADASCLQKEADYMIYWNMTRNSVKGNYSNINFGGPVGHYNNACGQNFTRDFIRNFSTTTDFVDMHEYGDSTLSQEIQDAVNYIRGLGYNGPVHFSEWNTFSDVNTYTNPIRGETYNSQVYADVLNMFSNVTRLTVYQATQSGPWSNNYSCWAQPGMYWWVNSSTVGVNGIETYCFNASKYFTQANRPGNVVVNTTSDTSSLHVIASKNSTNTGSSYVTLINTGSSSEVVTVQAYNLTTNAVTNTRTGTVTTVTGGQFIITMPAYTTYSFLFNETVPSIGLNTTSPNQNVSIVEPNNQTFSFTITNQTGGPPYSVSWIFNGTTRDDCVNATSCDFIGNYSSTGNYIINLTVTANTNVLTYFWNLTVNNTIQNISFDVLSPTSDPTITVGISQLFSYTLVNPDSITTNSSWYNNNTIIAACTNQTSCTLTGAATGTFNITVGVTGLGANTISDNWILTVQDASAAAVSSICNSNNQGVAVFSSSAGIIGSVLVLAVIVFLLLNALGLVKLETDPTVIAFSAIIFVVFVIVAGIVAVIINSSC